MSGERYPVLWIGQVSVVTLPAEIDVTNADATREELLAVLNQGAAMLVADMSKTVFCDSSGVSALVLSGGFTVGAHATIPAAIGTPRGLSFHRRESKRRKGKPR